MSEIRFSRRLGLRQAMARGLGVMVIVATFTLLGDVTAVAGPLAPLAFLLALLFLMVNLLGYVELALSCPRPGSAYVQVHEAQGGVLAFSTGWGPDSIESGRLCPPGARVRRSGNHPAA